MLSERLRVMSLAGPPDYRRPLGLKWWRTFDRIVRGFFTGRHALGSRVVDLGAGHFQLSELARLQGSTVIGVENDPALAALGRMCGHAVLERNWDDVSRSSIGGEISGVFSKFSISAIRARRRADIRSLCRRIDEMAGRRGWGWIAPWNGPVGYLPPERAADLVACQRETFQDLGWQHVELTAAQAEYFGVFGSTINRPLFLKRLSWTAPSDSPAEDDGLASLERTAGANGWLYAEHPEIARTVRTEEDFAVLIGDVLTDVIRPGATILDMRPQYYDLTLNVQPRGASVISLERDRLRASRFRDHGYRVLRGETPDALREFGPASLDGVFSWGHADVERQDQWKAVAADLAAATAMLKPDGWGWVAIERTPAANGRGLAAVERQFRSQGWRFDTLPAGAAARIGFRRRGRSVVVASRNCRSASAAGPATCARPVWIVGGSPEREWTAAAMRRRGYVNCELLRGSEAARIPLEPGGIVLWYDVGGVSSVPVEIRDRWLEAPATASGAGPAEGFTVISLPHGTTAVVMRIAAADRFFATLDRLPMRFEQSGAR